MVIDQLNTSPTGGAGVAALRLHRNLRQLGIDSRLFCSRLPPSNSEPGVYNWSPRNKTPIFSGGFKLLSRKLGRLADKLIYLGRRSRSLEIFTVPWLAHETPFDPSVLSGDVLHLHWVTRFLDIPTFFAALPIDHPLVWTLHDMNAFTGGCHHADGCMAFRSGCGNCPQLSFRGPNDLSRRVLSAKFEAVSNRNLHIVTPSRWIERLVRQSRVFATAKSIQTIYNGLDVQQFRPQEKAAAKRRLGVPPDRTVLAFGAASLTNRRKGYVEFISAINRISGRHPVSGLVFGKFKGIPGPEPAFPVAYTGYVDGSERQSLIYSAADIFVLPSFGENLAQTGVEALACGTPVVAFDVGGLSEYVRPGETGALAPPGNIESLADKLAWMIEHPEARLRMGAAGRELVERDFDQSQQARQYIQLYESIIADRVSRRAA